MLISARLTVIYKARVPAPSKTVKVKNVVGVIDRVKERVERGEKDFKEAQKLLRIARKANIDVTDAETKLEGLKSQLDTIKDAVKSEA